MFLYEEHKGKMLETTTKPKSHQHPKEQDPQAPGPGLVSLAAPGALFRLSPRCTDSLPQTQHTSHTLIN